MKIKAGDKFYCKKTVYMNGDLDRIVYRKGKTYTSEMDGHVTDEEGTKQHSWPDKGLFYIHFEEVEETAVEEISETTKGVKNDAGKLPFYTVLFKQFPLALQEVMKCSQAGHNKYHETDQDWQNFARVEDKEVRYKNAMLRHMSETGPIEDMVEYGEMTHEAAVVWNALADLETKLRNK